MVAAVERNFAERNYRTLHGDIPAFGTKDIFRDNTDRLRLTINLMGTQFGLPLVHIPASNAHSDLAIAWFNMDPRINPELANASIQFLVKKLNFLQPSLVGMTNSSKSEGPIVQAVDACQTHPHLLLLPSGKPGEKDTEIQPGSKVTYTPVTGTTKEMGLPRGFTIETLKYYLLQGRTVLVDDVYTTGATINAMTETLRTKDWMLNRLVVALEKPYYKTGFKKTIPDDVHAGIVIPEFVDLEAAEIDIERLYSGSQKDKIPPAIVF